MEEIHLFIIWSKANKKKKQIIEDISNNFIILDIINVEWSKEKFSENLSRFYGENLPKNSGKEKHCGNDIFTCIVVKDMVPKYDLRLTSKGNKVVNINTFDKKQLYRKWTGGGHKIHATDNINETKTQLALLFGKSYKSYLNLDKNLKEKYYKGDLKGAHGWKSFEELFNVLNHTEIPYVILRNFENLNNLLNSLHPDIDLLVSNQKKIVYMLNAKKTINKKHRVQYDVIVNNKKINFDLRYVGDNYYDMKWELDILENREKHSYFYIPSKIDLLYSLIYHAILHKKYINRDYILEIRKLCNFFNIKISKDFFVEENLFLFLLRYLIEKNYNFVEPKDMSVYFNFNLINKFLKYDVSFKRKTYSLINEKKHLIKKFINKINIVYKAK